MKPILKWAGSKRALANRIIEELGPIKGRYFEPFLGAGAVFFQLQPKRATINDLNRELIDMYRCLKSYKELPLLLRVLQDHRRKHSEEHYYKVRARIPVTRPRKAARTIYLNKAGFNGLYRVNQSGGFNVPWGKREAFDMPTPSQLTDAQAALWRARIVSADFEDILEQAGKGDAVYNDPPYDGTFAAYSAAGFDVHEQERLAMACYAAAKRGAKVIVSNSNTATVRGLYDARIWQVKRVTGRRTISCDVDTRGDVRELLIVSR